MSGLDLLASIVNPKKLFPVIAPLVPSRKRPRDKTGTAAEKKSKKGSSHAKNPNYSRREKSLGVLCARFLHLYEKEGEKDQTINLEDAANKLEVERRRIYDIVNILESVEVVSRKGKNHYTWHGKTRLANAMKALHDESKTARVNGAKLSLGDLSQLFIQMFLHSETRNVSLEEASQELLGTNGGDRSKKSKGRRLYDIANVLESLGVIKRIIVVQTRKQSFLWSGAGVYPLESTMPPDQYTIMKSGKDETPDDKEGKNDDGRKLARGPDSRQSRAYSSVFKRNSPHNAINLTSEHQNPPAWNRDFPQEQQSMMATYQQALAVWENSRAYYHCPSDPAFQLPA